MNTTKLLRLKIERERAEAKRRLENDLRRAKVLFDSTLTRLEKNEAPLDEHLIQNMMSIQRDIISYNRALEILPYLAEKAEGE